jgi:uncharacterized protein (DUF2384 family)
LSGPDLIDPPAPDPRRGRTMAFRKRRNSPLPTPEQSRRQSDVVRSAWRYFGETSQAIAFLNTRHEALERQPLHLAIESDEGLERVESLLKQLKLGA